MKYDFIIIGSGLGGLCAGIILAKAKKKVLILEQHTKPGGYLHSFYRKGLRFETGFHFAPELSDNGILRMYWDYLGIMDKIKIVPYDKKRFHSLVFPDFKIDLPAGLDNLKEKLISVFPNEASKIVVFIEKVKELRRYFVYFNRDHKGDLEKEHESFNISINDYIDSLGCGEKLKSVLLAHSFLYGANPKDAPLGTHAIFFNALYSSVYDIEGGGDALCRALKESFLENGGEMFFKKEVCRIITEDKKIKGVLTVDENFYEAENIISDINPKSSLNLFSEKIFRNAYSDRILEAPNTTSHFGGYFTTDSDLSNYDYDVLYFPEYDINKIYQNPVSNLSEDFFMYYTIPTARLGVSKEKHIIETLSIDDYQNYSSWKDSKFAKRPTEYSQLKDKILSNVLKRVEKLIPETLGKIDYKEGSTPLTNLHFTKSPEGSMYGIKHDMEQMRAPIRARTKLDGFYFTGQSLIFPGIVGVTITSFVTCTDILGQKELFDMIDDA
ncbi:MAG TPA: NAD(P)/FAD-dependent oxidoreductase [Spirochaetota bacterium]|nr:NAD(P)/FAD-dependent oxidoreductase [Spirochaetota bacterium]